MTVREGTELGQITDNLENWPEVFGLEIQE